MIRADQLSSERLIAAFLAVGGRSGGSKSDAMMWMKITSVWRETFVSGQLVDLLKSLCFALFLPFPIDTVIFGE